MVWEHLGETCAAIRGGKHQRPHASRGRGGGFNAGELRCLFCQEVKASVTGGSSFRWE